METAYANEEERFLNLQNRIALMLERFAELYRGGVEVRDTDFYRTLNIPKSRFVSWKYGNAKRINEHYAQKLASALGLSCAWVHDGVGDPYESHDPSQINGLNQAPAKPVPTGHGYLKKAIELRQAGGSTWEALWADAWFMYREIFEMDPDIGGVSTIQIVLHSGTEQAGRLMNSLDMYYGILQGKATEEGGIVRIRSLVSEVMKIKGATIQQVATGTGLAFGTIVRARSNGEKNIEACALSKLASIARYLNVSIKDLFEDI